MSATNFGIISGHLAKAPVVFDNKDGSKKVIFTIANNFGYGEKEGTNWIEVEGFVSAKVKGAGLAATLPAGSRISAKYELRSTSFEKDGVKHYAQRAVIADYFNDIEIWDTKEETAARREREAAKAAQSGAAAQAQPAAGAAAPAQGQFVQGAPVAYGQPQYVQQGAPVAYGAPVVYGVPGQQYVAQG